MGQRFAGKLRKAQLVLQACGFHLDDDLLEELLAFNLELAEKKSGEERSSYQFSKKLLQIQSPEALQILGLAIQNR